MGFDGKRSTTRWRHQVTTTGQQKMRCNRMGCTAWAGVSWHRSYRANSFRLEMLVQRRISLM